MSHLTEVGNAVQVSVREARVALWKIRYPFTSWSTGVVLSGQQQGLNSCLDTYIGWM